jgi:lupus La protein
MWVDFSTLRDVSDQTSPAPVVTFYFSDSNLFFDKFLWTLVCKSPEGWVPLETVASFKRMRDYLQTYGLPFIAQAVRDVHPAAGQEGNEIEVDAEGKQVRRTKSLEKDTSAWDRTLYVKGFGEGETGHNSQEQVEEWFKPYGPVNAVRFRREGEGKEKSRGPFKVRSCVMLVDFC